MKTLRHYVRKRKGSEDGVDDDSNLADGIVDGGREQ
jgi:hypothetical protein